jgi:SAM-dependent methyltransferase
MDRKTALFSLFRRDGLGLEIGPSINPLLPKSEGYNVETLDHLTAEQLRLKYAGAADTSRIEPVDYVWQGQPLSEVIGAVGKYAYIVASHVIEHTTDLLGFLLECEKLLGPDGVLALVVPDKRYCFDAMRPRATTGGILQAHLERRTLHTPGQLFDEIAYNVLRENRLMWPRHSAGSLEFARSLELARWAFEEARGDNAFHDIHAWQFTPSCFRLIVKDLHACGYIRLDESSFLESDDPEFFMTLSRTGAGCPLDRMTLLQNSWVEERDIAVCAAPEQPRIHQTAGFGDSTPQQRHRLGED